MRKSLKPLGLASAAAMLALAPTIASAQNAALPGTAPSTAPADAATETASDAAGTAPPPAPTGSRAGQTMTPDQQQAAIATWPAETQAYYQSLSEARQKMFWALPDSDKVRLSQMPEEQRESVWAQIESRVKPLKS